jgi:hypothetical protein
MTSKFLCLLPALLLLRGPTIVTTNGSNSCSYRYRVTNTLKPGFSEFKTPMLSRNMFGYYKEIVVSNLTCSIHNED